MLTIVGYQVLTLLVKATRDLCAAVAPSPEMSQNVDDALADVNILNNNELTAARPEEVRDRINRTDVTIRLKGQPEEIPSPLYKFVCRARGYQALRKRVAGLPAPNPSPPLAFFPCPMCYKQDLRSVSNPRVHPYMKSWAGIELPICTDCTRRVEHSVRDDRACMVCCTNPYKVAVRRDDCNAIILLCPRCRASAWLKKLEAAGMPVTEADPINGNACKTARGIMMEHADYIINKHIDAATDVAEENGSLVDVAAHADKKRRTTVTCACGGQVAQDVKCRQPGCEASVCETCLMATVGNYQFLRSTAVLGWRCEAHPWSNNRNS